MCLKDNHTVNIAAPYECQDKHNCFSTVYHSHSTTFISWKEYETKLICTRFIIKNVDNMEKMKKKRCQATLTGECGCESPERLPRSPGLWHNLWMGWWLSNSPWLQFNPTHAIACWGSYSSATSDNMKKSRSKDIVKTCTSTSLHYYYPAGTDSDWNLVV